MALAVEPSPTPPLHFYVAYSVIDPAHPSPTSEKPTTVRVSRFTIVHNVASPTSERVIEGRIAVGRASRVQRRTASRPTPITSGRTSSSSPTTRS